MSQESCYQTRPSILFFFRKPKKTAPNRAGARAAVWACAALMVLMCLPVPSARAQGYMFGRASFSLGSPGDGRASVAVGDFNGDGMIDLAIVQASRNSVAILLGKVDGTLAPATYYETGNQPVAVAVGDFSGDGRQDLVISNQNCGSASYCGTNGSISILLGNGDGTFQQHTEFTSGTRPGSMAVGDFNGDGKLDLAVSNGALNSVWVLLGNGDGTFQAPVSYSTPAEAVWVVAGDFNGDGRLDLAIADSGDMVSIFLGRGDGTFQHASDLLVLLGPNAVIVGDFNGDGIADLAVTYQQENAVSILLGNGDGSFQPRLDYPTGIYPTALAAGDFNGDGRLDLAVANGADQTFSILLGNGDGTLEAAVDYLFPGGPAALAVADFNRDGKPDLAVVMSALGAVSIVTGRGDGMFPEPQAYGSSQGSWAIAAGDFDGDGKLDLVTTNLADNSISLFLGGGDGTFQMGAASGAGQVPVAAAVGDFNRDGKLDLAVVNQTCTSLPCSPGSVSIFLGNGDGTFQPRADYAAGNIPVAVAVADFNSDGIPDLAVVNNGFGFSNSISILLGRGDGTFRSGGTLLTGTGPFQAVAADFEGNGTVDLATGFNGGISIIPGRGNGTFGTRSDYATPNGALAIAAGDFNRNGKTDLAVTTTDSVVVLLGNGDGTFQSGLSYYLGSSANLESILVGDFNGDGKLDLLVGKSGNAVSILLGNGDGTFLPPVDVPAGKAVHGWVTGDFDGDGGLDLAVASFGSNAAFVTLNTPVLGLYPAGLKFGVQGVGTSGPPAAVTVSNPSGAPLHIASVTAGGAFTLTNGCPSTLAPGASCAFSVVFAPTADGDSGGMLTISDNAPGRPHYVTLQGTGIGGPTASASPSSLTFDAEEVGTASVAKTVTLANQGSVALSVSRIAASGDFAATDTCVPSLAAGAECAILVTFTPTAPGTHAGFLTITDNAASSPQTVALTGSGVAKPAASLSASSLAFGNQRVHTTGSSQTVSLSNPGNAPLEISSIDVTGDFAATYNCPASLGAGASCTISVSFTPATSGSQVGSLSVTDNAADSPQAVALTGKGTAPQVWLSASSLSFSSQVVGTTGSAQSLTLSNTGDATLAISGVTVTGSDSKDFSLHSACGGLLNPGTSCGVSLTFTPASAGSRIATLLITTDAAGSPQAVPLTGTGADFSLSVSAGSATALTVSPGQQAVFHITLAPGGMKDTVDFSCAGAPTGSTCQVSPATARLDGVTPVEVTVSVQTTAPSAALFRTPQIPGGLGDHGELLMTVVMLLALLAMAGSVAPAFRRCAAWALATLLLAAALLPGCGGGGQVGSGRSLSQPGTPVGAYTLTITASSREVSHSTTLRLSVQK